MKSLLVLFSYHHKNTEKIANVFAKVLDAQIEMPQQINPEELQEYSLIGFGSGIYGAKHHRILLDQLSLRGVGVFARGVNLIDVQSLLLYEFHASAFINIDAIKKIAESIVICPSGSRLFPAAIKPH